MAAITLSTAAKKAVEILTSSKKGRKFLLYTIGIGLFIVLLPLIALVGLFGFMSGCELPMNQPEVMANLPAEERAVIENIDTVCESIPEVFSKRGLTEADSKKAIAIYMACLLEKDRDTIAERLADCFEGVSDTVSVYDKVSETFSVEFTAETEKYFDDKYGVTNKKTPSASLVPARRTAPASS